MTTFLKRTLTGVIFVMVIAAGILLHPIIFAVVFAGILYLMLNEFYSITQKSGLHSQKYFGIIIGLLIFGILFLCAYEIIALSYIALVIPLVFSVFITELFRNKEKPLINISLTLLGILFIALPFSLLNFLIFQGLSGNTSFYPWLLIGIFFILWAYDSGAYIFGVWLGKTRLFERISPKKSWEGAIGGAVIASIVGILNSIWFQSPGLINWIGISIIIIVFGTFGDLIVSMFKRSLNIKDTGNLLPGHGGLLDRFDSLLFAVPFIFTWQLILNG